MIQNRLPEDHGNDVTDMIGLGVDPDTQNLFDTFRDALQVARAQPSVNNFRACVEAFDLWQARFVQQVQP